MDAYTVSPNLAPRASHEAANESAQSSISWSAVIAGAVVAAALALILLVLCVGLRLTTVSPWVTNTSGAMLGASTIIAAILIQLVASAIGGYIAGRLRTKWVQVHDDEVYFRDTAHGFIVWALATVVSAAFLTSAASTALGVATGSTMSGINANSMAGAALSSTAPATATPVAASGTANLAQPMTPEAMAKARSVAAQTALWTFLAMLVGAFSASIAATIGGRQRDRLSHTPRHTA
ncbi:MAG: hypothetical protein ABI881_06560 [Betaproteobacteria bacterium]